VRKKFNPRILESFDPATQESYRDELLQQITDTRSKLTAENQLTSQHRGNSEYGLEQHQTKELNTPAAEEGATGTQD
jgi:hypothetical protein